jgi:predicted NUDIX family phosphoesterase
MTAPEQIFVVRRADFFAGAWPQGFVAIDDAGAAMLPAFGRRGFFVDRPEAETRPEWKQLIPYCVLRRPEQVFCVQRKKAQTEARLHNLLSIGIGGHVNPQGIAPESDGIAFLSAALRQELDEELSFVDGEGAPTQTVPAPRLVGLLNDDATEVGSVHVGLVYTIDLPAPGPRATTARVREVSKMAGGFRHLAELETLWQNPSRFESWSRILFQAGIARQFGGAGLQAVTRLQSPSAARPEGVQSNENG